MVSYPGDLMEDATDFSWQWAKAAHAVLLCEMERGSLQWEDLDHIDRIHRAHAQKHVSSRSGWDKPLDHSGRKPWYCKNYQIGVCNHSHDHERNVADNVALRSLSQRAASRTQEAFRPKTRQAYTKMFRVFIAFCIYMQVSLMEIDVNVILSFCECLVFTLSV